MFLKFRSVPFSLMGLVFEIAIHFQKQTQSFYFLIQIPLSAVCSSFQMEKDALSIVGFYTEDFRKKRKERFKAPTEKDC